MIEPDVPLKPERWAFTGTENAVTGRCEEIDNSRGLVRYR
jgi:hypothetical protein